MEEFEVSTSKHQEFIDITPRVQGMVLKSKIKEGICLIFIPHTTAGITINENADPSVQRDILYGLDHFVPKRGFEHSEGNSPAHIKSSLIGSSLSVIIENGSLKLGTWQGIYFCEFDGPRKRNVWVKILKA